MSRLNKLPVVDPPPTPPLPLTGSFHAILKEAQRLQKEQNDQFVAVDHLLIAVIKADQVDMKELLKSAGTEGKALEAEVRRKRGGRKVDSRGAESQFEALNKCKSDTWKCELWLMVDCVDLTGLAEKGLLDPVIGRDHEIRRIIRILSRRTKANPALVGEP